MNKTPTLNEQGFYDIYSVWHVPFWQQAWFYWSAIAVALLTILAILFLIYKRYFAKPKAPITPWQKALAELDYLKRKPIITQEDGKEFYFALTAILKQYLSSRFGYPLQGKTDSEMASYLKDSELETKYQIGDICNGCMVIKFANQQAMAAQVQKHLATSIKIVQETIPTKEK